MCIRCTCTGYIRGCENVNDEVGNEIARCKVKLSVAQFCYPLSRFLSLSLFLSDTLAYLFDELILLRCAAKRTRGEFLRGANLRQEKRGRVGKPFAITPIKLFCRLIVAIGCTEGTGERHPLCFHRGSPCFQSDVFLE